jgi:hypothetical protein
MITISTEIHFTTFYMAFNGTLDEGAQAGKARPEASAQFA